jgi:hypothetical protein
MKNKLALAGVVAIALALGGCSWQTVKDWIEQNTPRIACKKAESEYAKWVAAGKPINFGGRDEKSIIRILSDAGYAEAREWCAGNGVIIK